MRSFPIALPVGGGRPQNRTGGPWCAAAQVRDAVAAAVRLHRWGLGFRQYSFRPITRVLQNGTFSAFQCLPLFWHAVVPSGFRLQVNQMTQEHSSGFFLTASGIQHRVPRHTVLPHTALRLMVSPPRGLTGQGVGLLQTDKPMRGEEGVGPVAIGKAVPGPATSGTFQEEGPKAAADEAVQLPEDPPFAMFEILKPAAKCAWPR